MIFPHARLGRRGYDEEHVRAFCAQVEQELTWLLVERASLGQQVQQLRQQIRDAGNGDPGHHPENARLRAIQIMSLAQKTADHCVSEAHEYCRQLAAGAKQRRDQMLDETRARVAQMLEQAQARGQHRRVGAHQRHGHGRRSRESPRGACLPAHIQRGLPYAFASLSRSIAAQRGGMGAGRAVGPASHVRGSPASASPLRTFQAGRPLITALQANDLSALLRSAATRRNLPAEPNSLASGK